MTYSDAYVKHLTQGPFPGHLDPWAEVGRYFQQLHGGMIDHLIGQMRVELLKKGYIIGKEASLQIAEGHEPDIYIQRAMNAPGASKTWDYELAAAEILIEPGILLEGEFDLQALHILHVETHRLVTVVEIISPNNKTKPEVMADYRMRREKLILEHGVNVVEVDSTRSVKRLVNDAIVGRYAYHTVVYLPGDSPYLVGIEYGQPLNRLAIPVKQEVMPVDLQPAYDHAYQMVALAAQINDNGFYAEDNLPFPSLLTPSQQQTALNAVQRWQETLAYLKVETTP